jgi:hypothetical protein
MRFARSIPPVAAISLVLLAAAPAIADGGSEERDRAVNDALGYWRGAVQSQMPARQGWESEPTTITLDDWFKSHWGSLRKCVAAGKLANGWLERASVKTTLAQYQDDPRLKDPIATATRLRDEPRERILGALEGVVSERGGEVGRTLRTGRPGRRLRDICGRLLWTGHGSSRTHMISRLARRAIGAGDADLALTSTAPVLAARAA